jgi:iron complex outermembrane recepter protein
LFQVAALAPFVTLSQNNNFAQLTIRGIGANVVNAGSDPSSAMYLDGVYLARPAMAFGQFLDIERVEVLRGPQGTLYGRNAVGAAINLISRPPANDCRWPPISQPGISRSFAAVRGPAARSCATG